MLVSPPDVLVWLSCVHVFVQGRVLTFNIDKLKTKLYSNG